MSTTLKLSVAEYDAMVAKGAFDDLAQKIELINGEISAMNPAVPLHDDYIQFLTTWTSRHADPQSIQCRIQSGITLPELDSRPEPDLVWVKAERYLSSHPTSDDVLLLIEVSHSTLKSDQQEKESLYARAGIPEYWIVDILHQRIHVHQQPMQGRYESVTIIEKGQSVAPLIHPQAVLNTEDLFAG